VRRRRPPPTIWTGAVRRLIALSVSVSPALIPAEMQRVRAGAPGTRRRREPERREGRFRGSAPQVVDHEVERARVGVPLVGGDALA